MMIEEQFKEVLKTKWRPILGRRKSFHDSRTKSWKAFGKSRKYPVFEVVTKPGDILSSWKPHIEVTKNHAGGIGSVWSLDLEAIDKLIVMLLIAREKFIKDFKNVRTTKEFN